MQHRSFKIAFVILVVISLLLLSYFLNGIVQTGKTSTVCSNEVPEISEYSVFRNGSTTLFSKIIIFNNGTLALNYLSGPSIIVYTGPNKTSIGNYTLSKTIPKTILPGVSAVAYVNITVPYESKISYFFQIDYYIGNWKPNSYLGDYAYVKYFSGVHFEWEG